MVDTARPPDTTSGPVPQYQNGGFTYDHWMQSIGIPVHRGFYVEDLRTLELGRWDERGYDAAFIQLSGQEGVSEARVVEIPPGGTLPPLKLSVDECVYVASGRGLATVWPEGTGARRSFEWQEHSMFAIPHGYWCQLSNAQGARPARLLHYNYLPIAMSAVQDPSFFFNNPAITPDPVWGGDELYSMAKE